MAPVVNVFQYSNSPGVDGALETFGKAKSSRNTVSSEALYICQQIVHYRKYFKIPNDIKLSKESID